MSVYEALKRAHETGIPISIIARKVHKEQSTLQKWLTGSNKYLSEETQQAVLRELRRIKQMWEEIDI